MLRGLDRCIAGRVRLSEVIVDLLQWPRARGKSALRKTKGSHSKLPWDEWRHGIPSLRNCSSSIPMPETGK